VEIERFVSVPGQEKENVPNPQSLPCSIIESWTRSTISRAGRGSAHTLTMR
jgi:hypothetical protein